MKGLQSRRWVLAGFVAAVIVTLGSSCFIAAAAADDKMEAQQLVEKAGMTFQGFMNDPNMGIMRELLKDAKGLFLTPQLLRGAFVVGASGGSGVLLTRDKSGKWSGPAFYTVGGASIGLQIGGDASEVALVIMTDRGVKAFLTGNFKLGVGAGIAVGPVGESVAAQTANLSADILSFSRSKGLYGGVSLQGAVVAIRPGLNKAYYGKKVKPAGILVTHKVANPKAGPLLEAVAKAAKK